MIIIIINQSNQFPLPRHTPKREEPEPRAQRREQPMAYDWFTIHCSVRKALMTPVSMTWMATLGSAPDCGPCPPPPKGSTLLWTLWTPHFLNSGAMTNSRPPYIEPCMRGRQGDTTPMLKKKNGAPTKRKTTKNPAKKTHHGKMRNPTWFFWGGD